MAINITRVYTRSGDDGKTALVGGARVNKDCRKLDSYGTVDELICLVGTARTVLAANGHKGQGLVPKISAQLEISLRRIQNRLFDVGSILATPTGESYVGMPAITDADATDLEAEMDKMQKSLLPLKSFVLPGGTLPNALLHQCRAVCRRAEREIVGLAHEEAVDPRLIKYVNRLSDLFFVMSRYVSKQAGVAEYLWEYGKTKQDPNPKSKPKSKAERKGPAKPKSSRPRR